MPPAAELEDPRQFETGFDWRAQTTSIADLRFPTMNAFQHGDAFLTPAEETAYLDLIDAVAEQRRRLLKQTADARASGNNRVSTWEEAFYQFANARRLSWINGHLRDRDVPTELSSGLADPFRSAVETSDSDAEVPYRMLDDLARFPEDYVGRPIVLYGRFTADTVVRVSDEPESVRGFAPPETRPELRLLRGSLTEIDSSQRIAMVDTQGLLTPQRGLLSINDWPASESAIPVVVKGWVIKQWDGAPLIYCESLRQLSPIPHFQLIRANTFDKRRLRDEEKWLYYETLRQLEMNSSQMQKEIAAGVLKQRIDDLMRQVKTTADADIGTLSGKLKSGGITEADFRQQKTSLQRQLDQRIARYRKYQKTPAEFQTYVDTFQHPDVWHGHLLTLQGHVRHVVSYPGDETLFGDKTRPGGRMLHELWLFTDDSQHNPAVIVTPHLPKDFPVDADVIDRVTVTGCFFKRYVYGSQDTARIAPLVLAGRIAWEPTVDQVQSLVAGGHLAADSPRAMRADALAGGQLSDSALLVVCFFVVLTLMILWGRAQREERDRVRLRKRVNEVPEFENPQLSGYSLPLSDYAGDYQLP